VGVVLGLAALAKFSAVLLLPVVAVALLWARPAVRGWRRLQGPALMLGAFAATCGWHFGRVWWRYGDPLIGNWNPALGFVWWQDPGYRTVDDFWRFGRALVEPWYAGFYGVADGLWSTLWLDGLAGGQGTVTAGPPWQTGLMAVGALLGVIPTVAAGVGAVVLARRWCRGPSVALAVPLALLAITGGAVYWMALQVPSYAQAKAFYGQPALVGLVLLVAVGATHLLRRRPAVAWPSAALLALWGLTALAAAWVEDTPRAWLMEAEGRMNGGDTVRAEALYRRVLAAGEAAPAPVRARAQLGLARVVPAGEAAAAVEAAHALAPEDPAVLVARGALALSRGEVGPAEQLARRAVALAPAGPQGYRLLAAAFLARGRAEDAEAAWRQLLALEPTDPTVHHQIAALAQARGDTATAERHRRHRDALTQGGGKGCHRTPGRVRSTNEE
jgi:hypothetical protein